jgi:hypothetical protein
MHEVVGTDEFADWYRSLTEQEEAEVANAVGKLETLGLRLGEPHCSAIKGASFALRELRCRSGSSPLRTFYAYDPRRDAVLIIGGDKSGDPKFYDRMIPRAESIWNEYIAELPEVEEEE